MKVEKPYFHLSHEGSSIRTRWRWLAKKDRWASQSRSGGHTWCGLTLKPTGGQPGRWLERGSANTLLSSANSIWEKARLLLILSDVALDRMSFLCELWCWAEEEKKNNSKNMSRSTHWALVDIWQAIRLPPVFVDIDIIINKVNKPRYCYLLIILSHIIQKNNLMSFLIKFSANGSWQIMRIGTWNIILILYLSVTWLFHPNFLRKTLLKKI